MTRGSRPWRGLEWFESQAIHVWLAVGHSTSEVARGMRLNYFTVDYQANHNTDAKRDAMSRVGMRQRGPDDCRGT